MDFARALRSPARWLPRTLPLLASMLVSSVAPAAVFNLLPGPDGIGVGTLRNAITQANASAEDDTINLAAGDYFVSIANLAGQENANATGDLDVNQGTVTINGAGRLTTRIVVADQVDRVFQVGAGASLLLRGLSVDSGHAIDDGQAGSLGENGADGGGILCSTCATIDLVHVGILANLAQANDAADTAPGGGDGADGLNARGGGIASFGGAVRIAGDSFVDANGAIGGDGGAGGDAANSAPGTGGDGGDALGGGIYVSAGELDILDTTVLNLNGAIGGVAGDGGESDSPEAVGGSGGAGGAARGGGVDAASSVVTILGSGAFVTNYANGGDGGDGAGVAGAGGFGGGAAGGGLSVGFTSTTSVTGFAFGANAAVGGPGGGGGDSDSLEPAGAGGTGGGSKGAGIFFFQGTATLTLVRVHDALGVGGSGGGGGIFDGSGAGGVGGSGGGGVGGGVLVDLGGSLTVVASTIEDSEARGGIGGPGGESGTTGGLGGPGGIANGGGIHAAAGAVLTVRDSTLARNQSTGATGGAGGAAGDGTGGGGGFGGSATGGGILNHGFGPPAQIVNSTLSGNAAVGGQGGGGTDGGAGGNGGSGRGGSVFTNLAMLLSNTTINLGSVTPGAGGDPGGLANAAIGGNIFVEGAAAPIADSTIVANGSGFSPDLSGSLFACASLVEDLGVSGVLVPAPGPDCANQSGLDPQLLALASNGGPTATHAIALPTSPVVDLGVNPLALANDQRQAPYPRVSGPRADVGAYELPAAADAIVTVTVAPAAVPESGPGLTYTFARTDSQNSPLAGPLTVCFTIAGSATLGGDYTGIPTGGACGVNGIVTFSAGSPTAVLIATPNDDAEVETSETVSLTVIAGSGYTPGAPANATGTILDNETSIPTLGEWGLLGLALLLAAAGLRRLRAPQRA